jgi:Carbohydrate esterase, sialic acid-specific acetylesterase
MPAPYDSSWKGVVQALVDKGFGDASTQYDYSIQGAVRILQNLTATADSAYGYDWRGLIEALQGNGYGAGKIYDASMGGAIRACQNIDQSAQSVYDNNFAGLIAVITARVINTVADWISRVSTAGGTISAPTRDILKTYWEDPINEAGLKDKIVLFYPFVGSGINTQRIPYVSAIPLEGEPIGCFNSDFTANGFTGDGISKHMNLTGSQTFGAFGLSADDFAFIVYGTNLGGVRAATEGLMTSVTTGSSRRDMLYHELDGSYRVDMDDALLGNVGVLVTAVDTGIVGGQSPSASYQRIFLSAGGGLGCLPYSYDINGPYRTGATSNGKVFALAYDNGGTMALFSPATLRAALITKRISDAKMRLLGEILEQLQVRLSRSATGGTAKTLEVTTPVNDHLFQRDLTTDRGTIQIEGYYAGGVADDIEAQLDNGVTTTSWEKIASVKRGSGAFNGTLTAAKGEYTLRVRAAKNPGTVITRTFVGIGDIFLVVGQSNAAGQFNNAQPYSGSFRARKLQKYRTYEELTDPTGAFIAGGSVWPRLATLIMARTNCPVAFINAAVGSTALVNGAWNTANGTAYDQAVYTANQAASGGILRVLIHQGESDTTGTTRSAYNAAFVDLGAKLKSNCNVIGGMISAQIGTVGGATATNIDNIRLAQSDAWNSGGVVAPGFPTYNRVLADNLHWTTDADAILLAQLWMRAIDRDCYGGTEGRAPRFLSASRSGANVDILLQDGVMPLTLGASPTTGFAVVDGNGTRTVNSVSLIAGGIRLTCDQTITGSASVSLGSGNTGAGNTILDSGVTAKYPIEPFVSQTVA